MSKLPCLPPPPNPACCPMHAHAEHPRWLSSGPVSEQPPLLAAAAAADPWLLLLYTMTVLAPKETLLPAEEDEDAEVQALLLEAGPPWTPPQITRGVEGAVERGVALKKRITKFAFCAAVYAHNKEVCDFEKLLILTSSSHGS